MPLRACSLLPMPCVPVNCILAEKRNESCSACHHTRRTNFRTSNRIWSFSHNFSRPNPSFFFRGSCRRRIAPLNLCAPLSQRPQQHTKAANNANDSTRHNVFGEMNATYHAYGGYERIGHKQHASNQGAPGKPTHGNNRRRKHVTARKRPPRRIFLDQRVNRKQLVRTRCIEPCAKRA